MTTTSWQRVHRHAAALALVLVGPLVAQAQDVMPVRLAFQARVGSESFACGKVYSGIGSAATTVEATEFKAFVHDVRLVRVDGKEVPVELTQDGLWQSGNVALLDFEDGTGKCTNGNPDRHEFVEGTVPAGEYRGVRFTLGLPFDVNHGDASRQPSPLSLTRMFWVWNAGHKFLRLDLRTPGAQNWMVHLGSTECTPSEKPTTVPTTCKWPNLANVSLDNFAPARDAIVFDVAALLKDADVSTNQPKTASGCMSAAMDRDCTPVFAALGLAHGAVMAGTQRVFRVETGAAVRAEAAGAGR